jgi:hypothetical protein
MVDSDDIAGESTKLGLEVTNWALPCEECGHLMRLFRNWMAEPQPAWDGWCLNLNCRLRGIVGRAHSLNEAAPMGASAKFLFRLRDWRFQWDVADQYQPGWRGWFIRTFRAKRPTNKAKPYL